MKKLFFLALIVLGYEACFAQIPANQIQTIDGRQRNKIASSSASGGGGAQTNAANVWTSPQTFNSWVLFNGAVTNTSSLYVQNAALFSPTSSSGPTLYYTNGVVAFIADYSVGSGTVRINDNNGAEMATFPGRLRSSNAAESVHVENRYLAYGNTQPSLQWYFGSPGGVLIGTWTNTGSTVIQTNLTVNGTATFAKGSVYMTSALTPATSVNIDFNDGGIQTLANSTNVTFTESNAGAGKSVTLVIVNDSNARTVTWPAWTAIGSPLPSGLTANKTLVVNILHTGSTEASGLASTGAQP